MGELEQAIKALNKKFGKNYIGTGSEIIQSDYVRHSLGNFALDIGIGKGLPDRKIMMMAGKESSGKTTTALLAVAEAQKNKQKCLWVDVEHGFDPIWATKLGVDVKKLLIANATTIEEISDTVEPLIMTGELGLIVVDSIAAAPSAKELEDSAEQKSMGGTAKVVGLMMKKLTARLNNNELPVVTRVILLNQIRDNVGGWGAPEYTPGGKGLHFHSDIIVWLRPDSEPVGGKDSPKGIKVKFKVTKNRTAPPFKVGSYDLLFSGRIDNVKSMFDKALEWGLILKEGPWYTFGEFKVRGMDNFVSTIPAATLEDLKAKVIIMSDNPPDISEEESKEIEVDVTGL